jgi:hypothetical protein
MGEYNAPLKEHFGQILQAELVSEAPQYHEADDIRGILEMVERRACALVKATVAAATAETTVA